VACQAAHTAAHTCAARAPKARSPANPKSSTQPAAPVTRAATSIRVSETPTCTPHGCSTPPAVRANSSTITTRSASGIATTDSSAAAGNTDTHLNVVTRQPSSSSLPANRTSGTAGSPSLKPKSLSINRMGAVLRPKPRKGRHRRPKKSVQKCCCRRLRKENLRCVFRPAHLREYPFRGEEGGDPTLLVGLPCTGSPPHRPADLTHCTRRRP